ncbi:unnamed protein product [Mesocestoides corti]|uniref:Ribosomal_L7Ae domain-containing protein n=1 Tax=Mesocestoides corti TaxID=53468 RepID=A0A0R3U9K3_MESCO|nr:unnamed protein product [Mesocestoides corti]
MANSFSGTSIPRRQFIVPEEEERGDKVYEKDNDLGQVIEPYSDGDCARMPARQSSIGSLERRVWVPVRLVHVFSDHCDRRMESIARVSDCKIALTAQTKKNVVGEVGRMAIIKANSKKGLDRCVNLLEEKFPAFQVENR